MMSSFSAYVQKEINSSPSVRNNTLDFAPTASKNIPLLIKSDRKAPAPVGPLSGKSRE